MRFTWGGGGLKQFCEICYKDLKNYEKQLFNAMTWLLNVIKELQALTLVGSTYQNPALDPLAVL